ncbi:adenosylcobinamide-GDP ribazoletransferase [Planosporangium flavigriseum]|uniref:adenosylcobinamide-GDP ribazoletransferase n=1 Tax=Planosporangium flavigriseum TaxID=373681 RepID=UPI00197C0724|nr:adenosylcobinamide-GDP ribazoletransferase [Planosporangium flavigriseum]
MRLALTTFTVAPVRGGRVDRATAAVAMSLAPLVGAALGVVLGGAGLGLRWLGTPALVAGVVTVGLGVLLTRGLHVDGLADTVDGLGSYRDATGTLEIMKKPDVGPFGVAAIVLVLLLQATCAAAVLSRPWPAALAGIAAATAAGRLAVTWTCRRGVPAARPDGLGAMVAGTVGWFSAVVGLVFVAVLALPAVPGLPAQGPVAVAVALLATALLVRHVVRRIGGVTGDVFGAVVEVGVSVAYVGLALS